MTAHTVWLASYPKSGNTWCRALLRALALQAGDSIGAPATAGLHLDDLGDGPVAAARGPLEDELGFSTALLTSAEIARLRPPCTAALDARQSGIVVRKIHDQLRGGPDGMLTVPPDATRGAIYLVRDPRDVAVSFAHHSGRSMGWAVDQMADPGAELDGGGDRNFGRVPQRLGTWGAHVTGWLDQDHFPVTVVRYEDLQADPVTWFGRIARAVGPERSEADLTSAVEATSFDRLRALEARDGFRERPDRRRPFFRRGQAGGWVDELPPVLARSLERSHHTTMARFGYQPG